MNPLQSRRFWTMLIDMIVSLTLYFVAKYTSPALMDDVKFFIAAIQPMALFLVACYTLDDINIVNRAHDLEIARLKALPATITAGPS